MMSGRDMEKKTTNANGSIRAHLGQYRLSRNLLSLEREGQLLLVNTLEIRPVLVKHGKDLVKAALRAVGTDDQTPPGDDVLYQTLYDCRVIVHATQDKEEVPFLHFSYNPRHPKSSISLYLLVSQDCNLRCQYCFADEFPYRQPRQMGRKVAFRAIRRNLPRLREDGNLTIIFFGGEPLMNWDLVKEVLRYVEEEVKPQNPRIHIRYTMTTNLTLLPDDFIPVVKAHDLHLLTDLDGHRADLHDVLRPTVGGGGSYARIVRNIATLRKAGVDLEIRATICATNQAFVREMAEDLRERSGSPGASLELVTPFDCGQEPLDQKWLPDIDRYLADIEALYVTGNPAAENLFPVNKCLAKLRSGYGATVSCGMPWGNMHIVDHLGDVYMCTLLVGQERYKLGNVFDAGFAYAQEEVAVETALRAVHVDLVPLCRECQWKYLCTGHCPIARLAIEAREAQDKNVPDHVKQYTLDKSCKVTKHLYERLLWDLANGELPVATAPAVSSSVAAALRC
jgi:uncharacterized protein